MAPELAVKANPNYALGGLYRVNCQKTVPTYELRRRGYDVVAKPRDAASGNYDNVRGIARLWGAEQMDYRSYAKEITRPDGTKYSIRTRTVKSEVVQALKAYPVGARVQMVYGYVGRRSGHTIVVERVEKSAKFPNGLIFVDPQPMTINSGFDLKGKTQFAMIRMDNREIGIDYIDTLAIKRGTP